MTESASEPQATQNSESAKGTKAQDPGPISDIHAAIADMYGQAADLDSTNPSAARWLRSKARYLERGLLKLALEFERDRERSRSETEWRKYKYEFNWHIECTKALVLLSQNALRLAALVNAGAAVALLAFLGNAWDSGVDVSRFASALSWFAAGLVVAAFASGAAYAAQLCYLKTESEPRGTKWHITATALFVSALLIFGIGCWITYGSFIDGPKLETTQMTERERPTPPPPMPRPDYPPPRTDVPGKIAPPPARPPGQPSAPTKPPR